MYNRGWPGSEKGNPRSLMRRPAKGGGIVWIVWHTPMPTYRSWNLLLTNKIGISATCSTKGTTMISRSRIFAWGPILSMILSANVYAQVQNAMSTQDRQEYLQKLQQILPSDPYFDAWLKNTGTLPPDFNALFRQNSLPDPLKFLNGRTVRTAAEWPARREEIESLSQKYVWGTFPPKPKIDRAIMLDERHEDGYTVRNLRLEFGPESKGTMRVRVIIPDGSGPFPALIANTTVL